MVDVDGASRIDEPVVSHTEEGINYIQYMMMMDLVAHHVGLTRDEGRHRFNLDEDFDIPDCDGGLCQDGNTDLMASLAVNPPLCAHLQRENARRYLATPPSLPTILCQRRHMGSILHDFPRHSHGPPHLHCLRCLERAVNEGPEPQPGVLPPVVDELGEHGYMREHAQLHESRQQRRLGLLEGTRIAYVGDSDSDYDLDSDSGVQACEEDAEEAGRHGCFVMSAGTADAPVMVLYCTHCEQFAPLTSFEATGHDGQDILTGDAPQVVPTGESRRSHQWVSNHGITQVLEKSLLACALLSRWVQAETPDSAPSSQSPTMEPVTSSLVFLFVPSFFDLDTQADLVDEFESDALCTHYSVALPMATVVGQPPHPQLVLAHHSEMLPSIINTSLPLIFPRAVLGFAMEWPTVTDVQHRINLLHQHFPQLRVQHRPVFVEDTQSWRTAVVLYHKEEAHTAWADVPIYTDPADDTECIRVTSSVYTVPISMPQDVRDNVMHHHTSTPSQEDTNDALTESHDTFLTSNKPDGCPFSIEARTIRFFLRMTHLAKTMHYAATSQTADTTSPTTP